MERFSLGERLRWVLRFRLVNQGVAISALGKHSEYIFTGGVAEGGPFRFPQLELIPVKRTAPRPPWRAGHRRHPRAAKAWRPAPPTHAGSSRGVQGAQCRRARSRINPLGSGFLPPDTQYLKPVWVRTSPAMIDAPPPRRWQEVQHGCKHC